MCIYCLRLAHSQDRKRRLDAGEVAQALQLDNLTVPMMLQAVAQSN